MLSICYLVAGALTVIVLGGLHGEPNPFCIGLWLVLSGAMFYRAVTTWNRSRTLCVFNRRERASYAPAGFGLILGCWGTLGPRTDPHVIAHRRSRCASNLRQIGQALYLYLNGYHEYPQRLETLVISEEMPSDVFVCPVSQDTPASGPTTQATMDQMREKGHLSYLFVASGVKVEMLKDDQVVAFDRPSNHDGDGVNALFGDGHVEFFIASGNEKKIDELMAKATTQP